MARFVVGCVALLVCAGLSPAHEPHQLHGPTVTQQVETWIAELGSADFRTRQAATRALDQLGRPALAALRQTVRTTEDAEIRQRAAALAEIIGLRVENEDAVAATRITLKSGKQKLEDVLRELTKLSKTRLTLTDPSLGKQIVSIPKITDQPFWSALETICLAAHLEISLDDALGSASQSAHSRTPAQDVASDLRRITEQRLALVRKLHEQTVARQKAAANPQAIRALDEVIAQIRTELAANVRQLTALQMQQMAQRRMGARLPRQARQTADDRVIVLRPQSPTPLPSCIHGGIRIVAPPIPEAVMASRDAETLPVLLELQPEAHLNWLRVDRVAITKVTDADGQELTVKPAESPHVQVHRAGDGKIVVDANGGVNLMPGRPASGPPVQTFHPKPTQHILPIRKPNGTVPHHLGRLEGTIHGTIRTQPEVIAAMETLPPGKTVQVQGRNGAEMTATLTTVLPGKRYTLDLLLHYNPTLITAVGETGTPVAPNIMIRGGGGIAQAVVVTNGGNTNSQAFDLTDADGNNYQLVAIQNTNRVMVKGGKQEFVRSVQFVATSTREGSGPPTQLTFRGTMTREVAIPFALRSVPLSPSQSPPVKD